MYMGKFTFALLLSELLADCFEVVVIDWSAGGRGGGM
jgi:hypothetical protein